MRFVDQVTIHARSGSGGAGCVAFRREKYVPKGGPAGGNGGRGGSVILMADKHLYTLLDLRYNPHQRAPGGEAGQGNNRAGKNGRDLILRVPCGTMARLSVDGTLLGEVLKHGDQLLLVEGGGAAREILFSSPRHASYPDMRNPESRVKKSLFNWNSRCWPMSDWLGFRMQEKVRW